MAYRISVTERRAKAQQKRDRMRQLAEQVSALDDAQRAEFAERAGGLVTIEGHPLSPRNAALVLFQMGNASVVGGYDQWKRAGRQVQADQHGAMIWVPSSSRAPQATEPEQADQEGEDQPTRPAFRVGYVFDITQTAPLAQQ